MVNFYEENINYQMSVVILNFTQWRLPELIRNSNISHSNSANFAFWAKVTINFGLANDYKQKYAS